MLIVVRHGHRVLFPDSTEAGQFRGEILADLDGGRNQDGAKTDWIVMSAGVGCYDQDVPFQCTIRVLE